MSIFAQNDEIENVYAQIDLQHTMNAQPVLQSSAYAMLTSRYKAADASDITVDSAPLPNLKGFADGTVATMALGEPEVLLHSDGSLTTQVASVSPDGTVSCDGLKFNGNGALSLPEIFPGFLGSGPKTVDFENLNVSYENELVYRPGATSFGDNTYYCTLTESLLSDIASTKYNIQAGNQTMSCVVTDSSIVISEVSELVKYDVSNGTIDIGGVQCQPHETAKLRQAGVYLDPLDTGRVWICGAWFSFRAKKIGSIMFAAPNQYSDVLSGKIHVPFFVRNPEFAPRPLSNYTSALWYRDVTFRTSDSGNGIAGISRNNMCTVDFELIEFKVTQDPQIISVHGGAVTVTTTSGVKFVYRNGIWTVTDSTYVVQVAKGTIQAADGTSTQVKYNAWVTAINDEAAKRGAVNTTKSAAEVFGVQVAEGITMSGSTLSVPVDTSTTVSITFDRSKEVKSTVETTTGAAAMAIFDGKNVLGFAQLEDKLRSFKVDTNLKPIAIKNFAKVNDKIFVRYENSKLTIKRGSHSVVGVGGLNHSAFVDDVTLSNGTIGETKFVKQTDTVHTHISVKFTPSAQGTAQIEYLRIYGLVVVNGQYYPFSSQIDPVGVGVTEEVDTEIKLIDANTANDEAYSTAKADYEKAVKDRDADEKAYQTAFNADSTQMYATPEFKPHTRPMYATQYGLLSSLIKDPGQRRNFEASCVAETRGPNWYNMETKAAMDQHKIKVLYQGGIHTYVTSKVQPYRVKLKPEPTLLYIDERDYAVGAHEKSVNNNANAIVIVRMSK